MRLVKKYLRSMFSYGLACFGFVLLRPQPDNTFLLIAGSMMVAFGGLLISYPNEEIRSAKNRIKQLEQQLARRTERPRKE